MRKLGIGFIGDVPWGTHFCQFYQTKEDLIDILAPYFKAGLENNEFCMWVTSEPFSEKEAREAMSNAVPDFDQYLKRGQIEIVPHTGWYLKDGVFNLKRVLNAWINKLNQAVARGYDGIRITGNAAWVEERDWRNFAEYEEEVNNVIGKYRMIAICSYSLDKCGASDVIDVVSKHQSALVRRGGKWELIESSERKRAEEQIKASLKEKEVLLKEIYHRVKNNLQVVSSLLDMRSMRTHNQEAIDLLTEARAKIHTMALIHGQLYRSDRFDRIDMGTHIRELASFLSEIYFTSKRVAIDVIEPTKVYLPVTDAVPCGIALNEVISNALKHAFKEREKGTIEIFMEKSASDTIFMRVKDDGIGMPEGVDIHRTNSLGLKLVRNLVQEQLMGKIEVERNDGTEVTIQFNKSKKGE